MNKTTILTCAALLLAAPLALANGGGYIDHNEGADSCSSIIPFQMEDIGAIAMETEDLRVELGALTSKIRVRYTMRNTKDTDVKCRFGFPLDFAQRYQLKEFMKRNDYEVCVNGKRISAKCVKQADPQEDKQFRPDAPVPCWMVSELTAAPNEEFTLEISLTAPNLVEDTAIDHDSGVTNTLFHYRFSSAAVWNGPIRRGHVEFIPSGVPAEGAHPILPANRFSHRKSDGAWVWDFTDLEPTLDDDVTFQVIPGTGVGSSSKDTKDGKYYGSGECNVACYGDAWSRSIPDKKWTITGTHTDKHAPQGVFWATDAPDNGIGQSVTLNFRQTTPVSMLHLINGHYWKHLEKGEYATPTRVRITINGSWSKEYEVNDQASLLPILGAPAAKTLTITILDATPGKRPGACIDYLTVYRPLPHKPVVSKGR